MDWECLITDTYERNARLFPALLTIAPLFASGLVVLSEALSGFGWVAVLALSSGGAFLLAQVGRDWGKDGEKRLYSLWGGMPSVSIFRHRDTRLDPITKERYHKRLAALVETQKPTAPEEDADQDAADTIYRAWSNYLRVNTRGEKFELLFKENTSYGFRRNLWGLRSIGMLAAAISTSICVARVYLLYKSVGDLDVLAGMAGLFSLVLLILWIFHFTSDWVRIPADGYAAQLAESLEILHSRRLSP